MMSWRDLEWSQVVMVEPWSYLHIYVDGQKVSVMVAGITPAEILTW